MIYAKRTHHETHWQVPALRKRFVRTRVKSHLPMLRSICQKIRLHLSMYFLGIQTKRESLGMSCSEVHGNCIQVYVISQRLPLCWHYKHLTLHSYPGLGLCDLCLWGHPCTNLTPRHTICRIRVFVHAAALHENRIMLENSGLLCVYYITSVHVCSLCSYCVAIIFLLKLHI